MDWFGEFVKWVVEPIHMTAIAWVCGAGAGWIIGRSGNTRKFEIERDNAQRDLRAVLRTFQLKQMPKYSDADIQASRINVGMSENGVG